MVEREEMEGKMERIGQREKMEGRTLIKVK